MDKVSKARDILKGAQRLVTSDATNDVDSEVYLSDGECVDIMLDKIEKAIELLDETEKAIELLNETEKAIELLNEALKDE